MVLYHLLLLAQTGPRYTVPQTKVDPPVEVNRYVRRLGKDTQRVFFEKDLITFAYRGTEFRVPGWLNTEPVQVPGTDVFIAQSRYKDAEKVFLCDTYKSGDDYAMRSWHGPRAIKLPSEDSTLKGTIYKRSLFSKNLKEDRKYTVYIPPVEQRSLPAVYITDNQCEWFAKALEPLILAKKILPVALVGVAAGVYKGPSDKYDFMQDFRALEYLKPAGHPNFPLHMKFFCEEVVQACETEFNFISNRASRTVSGYSNGGAFALTAVNERSDVFQNAIVLSPGATSFDDLAVISKGKQTNIWVAAGKLETFMGNARQTFQVLKANGVPTHLDEYESGHDMVMWRTAFLRRLQACLTNKRPT